jgi:hypothetical protein
MFRLAGRIAIAILKQRIGFCEKAATVQFACGKAQILRVML